MKRRTNEKEPHRLNRHHLPTQADGQGQFRKYAFYALQKEKLTSRRCPSHSQCPTRNPAPPAPAFSYLDEPRGACGVAARPARRPEYGARVLRARRTAVTFPRVLGALARPRSLLRPPPLAPNGLRAASTSSARLARRDCGARLGLQPRRRGGGQLGGGRSAGTDCGRRVSWPDAPPSPGSLHHAALRPASPWGPRPTGHW